MEDINKNNPRPELGWYPDVLSHTGSRAVMAIRRSMRPRTRFLHGFTRVRNKMMLIIQATLAAGIAYWFALDVLGHNNPFFAPMAAFIGLNVLTQGPRLKSSVQLVFGAALGVFVGDLIISSLGTGTVQLTLGVFAAMIVGVFMGRGPLVVNQAASSAVLIATIMPPGTMSAYNRMIDALVGGIIGVIIMAVLPRNPLPGVRRRVATVLDLAADILYDVGRGLQTGDTERIRAALQVGRSSQVEVTTMDSALAEAQEQVKVSPLLWHQREKLASLARIVHPTDNAMRNIRILARRSIVAKEDHIEISPELVNIILDVSDAARTVRILLDNNPNLEHIPAWGELPYEDSATLSERTTTSYEDAIRQLRRLAARMHPSLIEGKTLSEVVVFAQCRSLTVDLLQVCGLSRLSAVATLPPTTPHPAVPPEVWAD